ncbi:MAG: hypothetical protein AAFV29_11775, partial [Myxococcota bacterium]
MNYILNRVLIATASLGVLHCGGSDDMPTPMPIDVVLMDATTPLSLSIEPQDLVLNSVDDAIEVSVVGITETENRIDVTLDSALELRLDNRAVASLSTVDETRQILRPLARGQTRLVARLGDLEAEVPVRVNVCRPLAPVLEASTLVVNVDRAVVPIEVGSGYALEISGPAGLQRVNDTSTSSTVVIDIPVGAQNRRHRVAFTAIDLECQGRSSPSFLELTHDTIGPRVQIEFPTRSTNLRDDTTARVFGRVGDTLTGADALAVTINGVEASVTAGLGTNGRFAVPSIPLESDEIVVVARDGAGNETVLTQAVQRFGGDVSDFVVDVLQPMMPNGPVGSVLSESLRAVVRDQQGNPVAD